MAESVVAICNMALDLLGSQPIMSLDDGIKTANLCKRNFGPVRDQVLRAYPWNSVMRRASLAADVEAPAFGYARQFALPEGPTPPYCLRVYQINGELDWDDIRYKVEGRKILTNEAAPLQIIYIARIEDVQQYDPLLDEAIAAKLAVTLASNLTDSGSRTQSMQAIYEMALRRARQVDAQEGSADPLTTNTWMESRY